MQLKNSTFLIQLILILTSFIAASCQSERTAEEKLLGVFQHKLSTLKSHEKDSYASYMHAENKSFPRDRKRVNALILRINTEYAKMSEKTRKAHEKKWQHKFQPVVDEIFRRTHNLVAHETNMLTQKMMAEIEKLSIQRKAMEKKLPEEKLKPTFFFLPSET